jgi:protein-tyrosine-phosphatase/DNA-binding MarR family transcriptional regulator
MAVVAATLVGVVGGVLLAGPTHSDVGPFEAQFALTPSWSGGTEVQIPPLGAMEFASHHGPVHLTVRLDALDQERTFALASDPNGLAEASRTAVEDVRTGIIRLVIRDAVAGLIGALLVAAFVLRRARRVAIVSGLAVAVMAASGAVAVGTFRPESVEEPTYRGLLSNAPAVIGDAQQITDQFGKYRDQLQRLVNNISKLYGAVSTLPVYQPTPGAVRVLHVSDLHLNPVAWPLIAAVVRQYAIDVVVDTGDINDWGSPPESAYVDAIGTLGVPYVYVRGNHDSQVTATAVAKQPNAVVLDDRVATIAGLTIAGIADPRFTPDKPATRQAGDPAHDRGVDRWCGTARPGEGGTHLATDVDPLLRTSTRAARLRRDHRRWHRTHRRHHPTAGPQRRRSPTRAVRITAVNRTANQTAPADPATATPAPRIPADTAAPRPPRPPRRRTTRAPEIGDPVPGERRRVELLDPPGDRHHIRGPDRDRRVGHDHLAIGRKIGISDEERLGPQDPHDRGGQIDRRARLQPPGTDRRSRIRRRLGSRHRVFIGARRRHPDQNQEHDQDPSHHRTPSRRPFGGPTAGPRRWHIMVQDNVQLATPAAAARRRYTARTLKVSVVARLALTRQDHSTIIDSMRADLSTVEARARVHAALGDPARLAIVDALLLGDASPGEIAEHLGMATNLVAHHVKVLSETGLVTRSRSEGDRRRTYLRLRPETLEPFGASRLAADRVVFVCRHNSARSQLAAALWRERTGRPVASAGTRPAARVHPRAVKIGRRHGLVLDPTATAHVDDVARPNDLLIAVCDNAHEDLAGPVRTRLHWSVRDPARVNTDTAFETAYTDLADRIDRLAPALTPHTARPPQPRKGEDRV